ncbi:hypothetical protein DERP_011498 [Dermatophagoides pteronyssinus]|uniref:Uncharacterized protein n=1 Tax=Dermatophagoides pteronyssinus TaxID=6956 RepID=A0ABQ8JC33_DERPT|nr:hypothetical protein DERP_011498 [Dermatophagoides pteronyssinus]
MFFLFILKNYHKNHFVENLARTAPELPCERVTLPQMTRNLLSLPGRFGTGFVLNKMVLQEKKLML